MTPDERLKVQLDRLQASLVDMRADYPDDLHFWKVFDTKAEAIEGNTLSGQQARYVSDRLEAMLSRAGIAGRQ